MIGTAGQLFGNGEHCFLENSYDPEFFRVWSDPKTAPPDFEAICDKRQELPPAEKH